jgi:putative DNA primase/helicase
MYDWEMERGVLGSMMTDNAMADKARGMVSMADFTKQAHAALFDVCCRLRSNDSTCDSTTVIEELGITQDPRKADRFGGAITILNMPNAAMGEAQLLTWCKRLRRLTARRRKLARAEDARDEAVTDSDAASRVAHVEPGTGSSLDAEHEAQPAVRDRFRGFTGNGEERVPKATLHNLDVALSFDTRLQGRVWFDSFRQQIMWHESAEEDRQLDDLAAARLALFLDRCHGLRPGRENLWDAIAVVAHRRARNPLVDWLRSLSWDAVPRLGAWLSRGCGVAVPELDHDPKDGPATDILSALSRRWMISAVARAIRPGCKADCVLVLQGGQGAFKSSALRTLAGPEWFSDSSLDIRSTKAYLQMARAWIYEVAELESVRRADINDVKAFLSRNEDTFVPPYGRATITLPRHTIFGATINPEDFIADDTGSRRFWPVSVGRIDLAWIADNRAQLWAEAVHAFDAGESWWLGGKEEAALGQHSERYEQADPWSSHVADWIANREADATLEPSFTSRAVLTSALNLDAKDQTRAAEMRVGQIVRRLGWCRVRRRTDGVHAWLWKKPQNTP